MITMGLCQESEAGNVFALQYQPRCRFAGLYSEAAVCREVTWVWDPRSDWFCFTLGKKHRISKVAPDIIAFDSLVDLICGFHQGDWMACLTGIFPLELVSLWTDLVPSKGFRPSLCCLNQQNPPPLFLHSERVRLWKQYAPKPFFSFLQSKTDFCSYLNMSFFFYYFPFYSSSSLAVC